MKTDNTSKEVLQDLNFRYRKAVYNVVTIEKQMRSKSFKDLSKYSQDLLKEGEYKNAISHQFDIVEEITNAIINNKITHKEGEAIIKNIPFPR